MRAKPADWPDTGPQSRAEVYIMRKKKQVPMPPVPVGGYLVRAFEQLGMFSHHGDGGMVPLSFTEIRSAFDWATDAERLALRKMSVAFIHGWRTGQDSLGIAPWEPETS